MEPERRKVIVREIEYWRKNRLLPEQYCDFLHNLYAEHSSAGPKNRGFAAIVRESKGKTWLIAAGIIAIISFSFINFNAFPIVLQIVLAGIPVIGLSIRGSMLLRRHPVPANVLIGLSSFVTLLAGEYIVRELDRNPPWDAALYIAACGLLWVALGIACGSVLWHVSGWMALNVYYACVVYAVFSPASVWEAELFWLPFVLLFGWVGHAAAGKNKSVGGVFSLSALIYLAMPEIYGFAVLGSSAAVQIMAAVKLAVVFFLLFISRKKWTGWISRHD
ncbi:MAG TPA: hypothetical protein VF260_07120 [Bacilli bacterium]